MTKHKVSELDGALLDAAVAKALGGPSGSSGDGRDRFQPSSHWRDGGPIIEREAISLDPDYETPAGAVWMARCGDGEWIKGPTPLIAAMRAFVSAKLGEEVELP
jgi:hypothetical protein